MSKYKTIYVDTDRLEDITNKADPGDFFNVKARVYPFSALLPELTPMIERRALDEACELLKEIRPEHTRDCQISFDIFDEHVCDCLFKEIDIFLSQIKDEGE